MPRGLSCFPPEKLQMQMQCLVLVFRVTPVEHRQLCAVSEAIAPLCRNSVELMASVRLLSVPRLPHGLCLPIPAVLCLGPQVWVYHISGQHAHDCRRPPRPEVSTDSHIDRRHGGGEGCPMYRAWQLRADEPCFALLVAHRAHRGRRGNDSCLSYKAKEKPTECSHSLNPVAPLSLRDLARAPASIHLVACRGRASHAWLVFRPARLLSKCRSSQAAERKGSKRAYSACTDSHRAADTQDNVRTLGLTSTKSIRRLRHSARMCRQLLVVMVELTR